MEKVILTLFFFIAFAQGFFAQTIGEKDEIFEVKGYRSGESIHLYSNGQFFYKYFLDMIDRQEIYGNWQQRDSFLILDSHPQKDRIIVEESRDKQSREGELTFSVLDKKRLFPMTYHLTVVTEKGDTICFRDQFVETIVRDKVKSFWLTDIKGLVSPVYCIQSIGNRFKILFETDRIFEDEHWLILNKDSIRPIGLDGKYGQYVLTRKQ